MSQPSVTSDTLIQIIGIKEVEIHILKQQLQSLIRENAELKSKSSNDTHDDSKL